MSVNWGPALGGIALAAGVAFGAVELGQSLVDMRRADRVVTVKGLAEMPVSADLAAWRIPYRGVALDRAAAVREAARARDAVRAFARGGGLTPDEISNEPTTLRIERSFVNNQEVTRFVAVGAVRLRTANVAQVVALTRETEALLDAGVLLGESDYGETVRAEYLFTGLNAIKPGLIADATAAARASAEQFAEDSGATVGAIASANQGVIQILPRETGFDERSEPEKLVRVVSTIKYYLDD